jgi:hypothetical protein
VKELTRKWRFLLVALLAAALAALLVASVAARQIPQYEAVIDCPGDGDCGNWCDADEPGIYVDGFGAGKIYHGQLFTPRSDPFDYTLHANGYSQNYFGYTEPGHKLVVDGNQLCCMQVQIPDDLAAAGGIVWINGAGGKNPLEDDECICLPKSVDIQWQLRVSGHNSQWYTKHVDCTPLDAGKAKLDSFCHMEIKMPPELAAAGATVRVEGSGGGWQNGQRIYLPVSNDIKWDLTVNGHTSQEYTKHVDCTPLEVPPCAWCPMRILMPWPLEQAGARVRIRGAGDQWHHGDVAYLPKSVFVEWTVIVNNKEEKVSHKKHVDCTPLMAGCAPTFCEMEIVMPEDLAAQGATLRIEGLGPGHPNGELIALPIGETIRWYLNVNGQEGPPWEKNVDCTPLKLTSAHYCGLKVRIGEASTLRLVGDGDWYRNDVMMVPKGYSQAEPKKIQYRIDMAAPQDRFVPPCGNIP